MNLPRKILIKSPANGFDFNYYLHIKGGCGVNPRRPNFHYRYGGEFDYIIYYACPEQTEKFTTGKCERLSCIEYKIPFGEGSTIEEAFENYKKKAKRTKYRLPHE